MIKLSIIIINYKSAHHVLNCLESVYKETLSHTFEVIVVDNDSGDDSEQRIRTAFPGVVWVQTGYNAGFARANNAGIKISRGEFVLLLNADTIVLEGALDKTIDLFEQDNDAVACGVQLLNPDGTHQISGARFMVGSLNFLLPLPYVGRLIRFLGYKLGSKAPSVQTVSEKMEVDWVVGAFLMVKKNILQASGLLDEDFFMYAEEIEWCSRLRKKGMLYLYGIPKVIHLGGGTSGDYYETEENENSKNLWNKKGRQILVSQFVRIRKQHGSLWFLCMILIFILEIPVFILGLLFEKLAKGSRSRFSWNNVSGYVQNIGILMRYVFKMLRNKPFFYKVY